jgi:large subunit ribosomal protein L9
VDFSIPVPGFWETEDFMKVILIENVPALGKAGEIVPVAAGFGRNYLIPKKLALEATPANLQLLERQKQLFLQKAGQEKAQAQDLAAQIDALPCLLPRPVGESEKLFGSVTTMDLQKFLSEKGISIDRRRILLAAPIKSLGSFSVPIRLHPEVTAQLKVEVVAAPASKEKA